MEELRRKKEEERLQKIKEEQVCWKFGNLIQREEGERVFVCFLCFCLLIFYI